MLVRVYSNANNEKRLLDCFCRLDINECATNNGYCAHLCTNTNGSYFCTCLTGFALSADHAHCTGMLLLLDSTLSIINVLIHTDINECEDSNGNCTHVCTNTIGHFMCSCRTGYMLDTDNRTCKGTEGCIAVQ